MSQNTGFGAAGGSSSETNWSGSGAGSSTGGGSAGNAGAGGTDRGYGTGATPGQDWMPQNFGGGQVGSMIDTVREFGRNNPKAALGASVLGVLALARFASASGRRRQAQRSGGGWFGSGYSYDGGDRSRGYGRDAFSGSGRYTGAPYGREQSSWGMGSAGRYGMNHPVGMTAGAALGALALSWLARGWSQNSGRSGQSGSWLGSGQSFGGQGSQSAGGTDWQSRQGSGMTENAGSSFAGSGSGSSLSGGQAFGSGSMGSDPIEASGSSGDFDEGSASSTFSGRSRTGTTSAGSI